MSASARPSASASSEVLTHLFGDAAPRVRGAREPIVAHGPVARLRPVLGELARDLPTFVARYGNGVRRPFDRGDGMIAYRDTRASGTIAPGEWFFFDALDDRCDSARELLHALQRALGARGTGICRAFFHAPGACVPRHCDDVAVVAIQLSGSRAWQLEPNRRPPAGLYDPVPVTAERDVFGPRVRTLTMRPGSVLYLPRGWWHATRSRRESFALSLSIPLAATAARP